MDQRLNWSLVLLVFILASHITDVLARHHHIKLRHARHRRQHGDGYLPASFVLDTDERETGIWGPWSAASSCSRSCGGGVADQTRSCQEIDNVTGNPLCTGARKRFFTCNVQACPEPTQDFRAEQCAEYNNVPIEGVLYDWIPYTGGPNKCELNCMPRGERFFYRHKVSVTDGTPCTSEANDVCVQGKCRPVGCDMMLGSVAKEDRCRECGGDGSACNTVQGLLDSNDLQIGYNDLLLIPAGATNIAISEVRPSNNYLAIRNTTGHYYLNGNWRIDFPRSLRFAGSVFHYERRPKEFSAADIINTLGPTNEALYIVLLHQDTNVGVNYEYSIPNRFSQQSSPDSYTWVAEEFSDCSASCGGGFQSRLVRCVRRGDNKEADPNLCDQQLEPVDTQQCGMEPCPPEWVVKDWGPCSKQCKSGGEQTRQIICEQIISGGVPSIVDDIRCLDIIGPKDIEIQACNEDVECPQWHIGPWKPCDHLCGKGKQTRKITCYKKEEGKIFVLGDSACEEERPESEKDCKLRPCSGVDWVVSRWSGCDDKCGLTQETRTTSCVTLDGEVWPEEQCNAETKPKLIRECSARDKCAYQWYATQWSECSVTCGTGIQTRKVFCGASPSGSDTIEKVEDAKCDPSQKYNSTKECIAEVEECKGEWFAGPWSECSKPCGSGEMTRKVICMKDDKVVPMSNCDVNDMMLLTEDCNKMACGEDEVIPVEPGTPIASTGDEEVECEDYQNDEFVSVDLDLDIVGPDNDDDRHYSFDLTSFGRGFDDLMMGDDPAAGGSPDEGSGDLDADSVTDTIWSETAEGSGYGTSYSSSDTTSFFSTSDPESTESPETSETEETTFTNPTSSGDSTSTYSDKTPSSDSEDTEAIDGSGASELPSSETSMTSESSDSSTPLTTEPKEAEEPEKDDTEPIEDGRVPAALNVEQTIPKTKAPKLQQEMASTGSSTESSSTSEFTSVSGSESSESLSTEETSEISESSTLSSSDETGFTTVSESSSSDTSVSTTADTTLSPDLDASSSSSSETSVSSSADTTLSPSSDASSVSSSETSVSSSADTTLSPSSDASSVSSSETSVSSSADTTLSPSSDASSVSSSETSVSSSADTTLSPSSDASSVSSSETSVSSSADTTLSPSSDASSVSSSETSVSSSADTTLSPSSDASSVSSSEASVSSSADTTLSPSSDASSVSSSETSISSSADTTLSPSSDTSSESSTDTTLSSSSDASSKSSADTTLSPSSEKSSESTADTTLSPSSDTSSESSVDTTLSPSSDASSASSVDTTLSPSSDTSLESSTDTTLLSSSDVSSVSSSGTSVSSSTDTTLSPSSDTSSESSSDTTVSPSAEITPSSSSDTTVSSSIEAITSSSSETTQSSIGDTSMSSSSEITGVSSSDTTISSSLEPSGSSSSATTESSSTDQTELSSSQTSGSYSETVELSSSTESAISSSETTESSGSDTPTSSSSETTDSSGSDTTVLSSSEPTESSGPDTTVLSSSETAGSSSSETTGSVGSETTVGLSSSDTTVVSSSEATESSSSTDTIESSGSTTPVLSSSEETTSGSSVSSATTESITSTDTTGSESTGPFEQSTVTEETDVTSEGYTTSERTEHGITSDTTESGITDTDEEIDTTGQSHITDIWTTASPVSTAISKEQSIRKCKPRQRKKTCKSSPFGCCYDGVKAATGPFGKGCPIPETCKETEFGCCPDGVSPATGPNNKGCPSSHCSETLFGCCPDNDTPAEGNDYEGCPIPCNKTEFGCCPDEKTPAAGKDNLGCCNVTAHGCCPDGVKPASGPDGEGCHEKETVTATTPGDEIEVTTGAIGVTTAGEDEVTSTSETAITTLSAVEECTNSEFGCCPDQRSTATGINYEGCGVINTENCTASYYGCCPDGVSAALGANSQGCHMVCENSTFGCCDDGTTPAHGPNKEGCCLATPYGCCPDNIRHAQGPDLYGCGCQYSRYGCCPDEKTPARGSNNEGCACEHTQHGCCPNRIAAASGPNFEGCPCHTYQFGCCPDGISIAKGPQSQGCGCENTEFKCCSDGITPAKGENYAGCTCDASKYGCCPDGVEEAQGENFEGCLTVPSSPGAACALERDRGTCSDFSVRWFFDTEYGGCSRFWYGGCEGNENRFKSQEECKDVCVEPKGRDACFLPKISGPCEGYHPTWYYDTERKQCGQFIYKGCLGNANKFKTREDCEELCVTPDDIDACEQAKEVGPCEGNFTRWYFNKETDSCEEFAYGGCKANKNNFPTQISCQQKCLTPGRSRVRDVCALEKESGPCPGSSLRWYYDTKRKSCRQFVYGGCKGNGNKFRTYAACEQRCPVRDSCSLPKEEGGCTEKHARWSFDQSKNRCMPFYYTGCGGNRNNYETIDACQTDCPPKIEQDVCLLPALLGECYNYTQRWYYDSYESRCRQFYYGGCGGNGNNFATQYECTNRCRPSPPTPPPEVPAFRTEFCFLRDDHGPCNDESVKWFYDSRDGVCRQFRYGGCAGNGNNFDTPEECESRCGNVQDLCGLPPVVGPCRASLRRYYYDRNTDTCNEFGFGGCQGNKNNFDDKNSCEKRCRKSIDVTTTTVQTTLPVTNIPPKSPICSLPLDVGPCTDDVTAYYYDINAGACQAFIYGGCEGNANRFQTEEQCERLCGSFQGQDVCNIQADPGPCQGTFPKFYYDPVIRGCSEFLYGGCDGNANRFTSVEECESICIHREEPTVPGNRTTTSNREICNEPVNIGSCSIGSHKRFYYDDERLNCIAFIYTGCGGNRNRFKNYESCIRTCSPQNEVDVRPEPESQDPCLAVRTECETIRCPYGKEEFVDEQNCPHCQCADPCRTKVCQEGTRCAVNLVSNGDSIGYQGVCRSILKPGNCPKVSNATTCQEECSSDADCDSDFKCCSNGCGSSCLQPAPVEPLTTPPPQYVVTVPYSVPEPLAIEQPEEPNVSAEEGSYVILKCACTGNPKPFITWRKDVTLIDNSVSRHSIGIDGSLQIVGLYRSDAGTYTCTADNRVAAPVRIQYILTITAPRRHTPAILGEPNYRVTVTLNSPTVLRCNVVGWPRPLVNWWHGDNMLPLADNVYEQQRDHSLRIHRVALINLGVYTCQAYNGIAQAASWSVILQAPGPVYNLNSENRKYAQYLVEPQRRPVFTTARPQYPYRPQTTKATEIQTYEPFRPFENPYNPAIVSVTEPSPEIVPPRYSVPVKVNVSADEGPFPEGSEFSIACDVDGYPLPRVGWFKDDNPIQMDNRITISAANRLIITDAERSDSGRYRCQAANELTSDADTVDIKVAGIYIHPNCQDNSFFAKCDLIVKGNFCKHQYYAKFCCRSCTEAGQLPARGSHINETRRKRRSILSFS